MCPDVEWSRSYKEISVWNLTLRWNWTIRDAKIGYVTYLIGQFQGRVKFYAGIFIGSFPGPNPKNFIFSEIYSMLDFWPMREVTIGHVTDVMVEFQRSVKFYTEFCLQDQVHA